MERADSDRVRSRGEPGEAIDIHLCPVPRRNLHIGGDSQLNDKAKRGLNGQSLPKYSGSELQKK